ncbi:helix-turn-helix transcriptional regulator [Clostridium sp. BJN0001]|uniref:helix-turn-helix domain-containing protein n=1 Tax=Clostridium sp. BJN0001 TaxID=2930219 RepID=UPI001FD29BAA|nr:helix-turn-helix transcriptional regulator [Clostridium sp. BJN0001]
MSFGENLQFLRKMHNKMTQEELAEKIKVSRQTVSKWELNFAYPEVDKIVELCKYFSCSMDQLVRENMNLINESYSDIRIEEVKEFNYIKYTVISSSPEEDAINHMKKWSCYNGIDNAEIIGWDFPLVSQQQKNVYHMHGYSAACILPSDFAHKENNIDIETQKTQKYAIITIKDPFSSPFDLIENAYKTLMSYMKVNNIKEKSIKNIIECYEKEYKKDGIDYMDIHIAVCM